MLINCFFFIIVTGKPAFVGFFCFWLKRLVSSDQLGSHEINVQSLNNLPIADQAEKIADKIAAVRNEYEPLSSSDIILPKYNNEDIPIINVLTVEKLL